MELDNRAVDFIQRAKAQGFSKDEVAKFLQDKGYDIGETPKYSALDKAKYMGRAGAEGLTLGAGDVVGGYTNILANNLADVTHGKDLKTRLKGAGNLALNLVNPGLAINRDKETFNQGRKDFVEEQEQFAQAHPGLNFAGELGGGLILGGAGAGKNAVKSLAKPTLWNMVKSGARTGLKEGAKWGAGYGFGSGLTEDANELNVYNALKGMGVGTVTGAGLGAGLGGALPVGIAGVVAGGKYLGRPLVTGGKKVADYFRNKTVNTLVGANKGLVEQSIKEGKPLIDIADQKLMDVAEGANLLNREAKQTFADYGKARIEGQHPKLVDTLGQYFDPRGSHQLLDELNADVQKGAKTLYDKAKFVTDKAGNIVVDDAGKQVGKVLPELEKLNKYEMDYISQVYGTKGLEYEVQGLPQNDMRILDYAKQLMDDDIQQLLNKGKNRQAAILAEKRASFIAKIDKANPEYKTARNFFERGKRAENALQAGRSALSGERENLAYDFNKLTPEEKFYFRQGVGNKLEELSNQKTEGGNVFQKVFNAENRRRLKGLDIKNYADLEKTVLAESKAASNINSLRGGSPTADRLEAIKRFALGVIRRPTRTITNVLANTAFKPFYANPAEVAKAMTDPVFLSKLYAQAEKNGGKGAGKSVIEALNQIGTRAGGVASEEPTLKVSDVLNSAKNTINNKGGYIGEQPKVSQVLNSLGEPVAKTEEGVKNFNNWFKGSKVVDENGRPLAFADGDNVYKINGYSNEGVSRYSYKGGHRAPSFEDTPVRERIENGGDFNLKEILKGYSPQPNDYFSNARVYGYDTPAGLESAEAIQRIANGEKKLIAYRAVPKDVGQTKFNNGDWITFSKKYAEEHGGNALDGNYKIIEQKVSPKEVWWDGNDINEWGFDNGKGKVAEKELYLNIKKPKYQNTIPASQEEAMAIRDKGYDGVITPDGKYFVFSINQIKNKNNTTFDPKNPNIYKSLIGAGGLGSIAQILNNKEAK